MVDIRYLKSRGVSAGQYKKIFSADRADWPRGCQRLINHVANRIKDGRTLNLKEWRSYAAIDFAYDVPFNQTTPTLVHNILSRHPDINSPNGAKETMMELETWGLAKEDLFMRVESPQGAEIWLPNPPVFFQIFIPVVRAYVGIRLSKLYNDRNLNPLLPYKPLKEIERDQVICEVITDLVNGISMRMGYSAVLRQCILQTLKYGLCLTFPAEEWYCEKQKGYTGELKIDGSPAVKTVTVKEGLRYLIPDPTRMYYDLTHPLTSLNTDTGTQFCGHWRVMTYGDILDNRMYWNRKHIFAGTNWFQAPMAGNYFTEIFPCTVKFPVSGAWNTPIQRDDKAAWYNSNQRDQAIFVTEHFERLVPKDWGLADYKYPVWHRFTIGADDTPLWVEPCAYTPSWFMGYDYDEHAGRNSSLGLELIPWQDHLGNILSQMILTAKQNLAKVIFYDNQQVAPKDIAKLRNVGEQMYRGIHFVEFDSLKSVRGQLNPQAAFFPVQLGQNSIAEQLQLIPTTLNIMERVLQISAQEAASAASHQQSKEEIIRTGSAGTNRLALTGSYIDEGTDAWKDQLYEAAMAYVDPNYVAMVSNDIPNAEAILDDLGFEVVNRGKNHLFVRGTKELLQLEGFARSSDSGANDSDKETAQIIMQTLQAIAAQDELRQKIGSKTILAMMQFAAKLASPRLAAMNFRLQVASDAEKNGEVPANIIEAIKQAQQATQQAIGEQIGKPAAQAVAEDRAKIAQLEQVVKQLQGIFQVAQKLTEKQDQEAQASQAREQTRQVEFQNEQRRKEERHQLDLHITADKAAQDKEITEEKAKADAAAKAVTAKAAASKSE